MGFLSVTAKPIPTPAFPSKGKETSGWPRAANSSQTCCSPRQHPLDQVRQLRRRPRPPHRRSHHRRLRQLDRGSEQLAQQRRQLLHGEFRLRRSEEHTSELQSLMRISYAVFCLKTKNTK